MLAPWLWAGYTIVGMVFVVFTLMIFNDAMRGFELHPLDRTIQGMAIGAALCFVCAILIFVTPPEPFAVVMLLVTIVFCIPTRYDPAIRIKERQMNWEDDHPEAPYVLKAVDKEGRHGD